jgi:hypothetical protein
MATTLQLHGWRLFFWENEPRPPVHVHARKGDVECRLRLFPDRFDLEEAWACRVTPALRRELRQLVFAHFDQIVADWTRIFRSDGDADE